MEAWYCANATGWVRHHHNVTTNSTTNSTFPEDENELEGVVYLPQLWILLAFIASLIAAIISLFNVYKHLINYSRPEFQKPLIRIILIVPIYAVSLSYVAGQH